MSKDTIHVFNDLAVKGLVANGSLGTTGQGLVSNGSATYWSNNPGYTGSAGPAGINGFTGSAGTNGFTGSQGSIGYTGSWGGTAQANVDMNTYSITNANTYSGNYIRLPSSGNIGIGITNPFYFIAMSTSFGGQMHMSPGIIHTYSYSLSQYGSLVLEAYETIFRSGNSANEAGKIDPAGSIIGNYDMRAPLFYDYDNTAYYLDAANTGTSLNVAGAIQALDYRVPAASVFYLTGDEFRFRTTGGTERMRLDASGNLGLGVPPSAWDSVFKSVDGGGSGCFGSLFFQANGDYTTALGSNLYYNAGWKYKATAAAGKYELKNNTHAWYTAPSGTAGAAISFTQAMTLDASGVLLVNRTSTSGFGKLNVDGGADFTGGNVLLCRDTGNVGIGTSSPSARLTLQESAASPTALNMKNRNSTQQWAVAVDAAAVDDKILAFIDQTNSAVRMSLDASGNLGLGVTPSAWRVTDRALDIGSVTSLVDVNGVSSRIAHNVYWTTGDTATYKTTNFATFYNQQNGRHSWWLAPSGSAGAAISFTQAMVLYENGNLGIGETTPTERLQVGTTASGRHTTINSSGITTHRFDDNSLPFLYLKNGGITAANQGHGIIAQFGTDATNFYDGGRINFATDDSYATAGLRNSSIRMWTAASGSDNERFRINSAGVVTAFVDMRAPLFYDSDNTAYYVDPNNTSVFATATILSTGPVLSLKDSDSDSTASVGFISYQDNGGAERGWVGFGSSGSRNFTVRNSLGMVYLYGSYAVSETSHRSQIFYDHDNTAYFIDPNGFSNLNRATITGTQDLDSAFLTSYNWDGAVHYYWNKVATIATDGILQIEILAKTDANYIPFAYCVASIATFNGTTFSIKLDSLSSYDLPVYLAIDNDRNVWVKTDAVWNSYFKFRVLHNSGATIYKSSIVTQEAQPTGSVSIQVGQSARGTQGSAPSATISNTTGLFGITNAREAMYSPIFYDSNNTSYYVNPDDATNLSAVRTRGQVRATGWWGEAYSGSVTGLGIEIGRSGSTSYVLSYNRDAATYGPMQFEATSYNFASVSSSYVTVANSVRSPIFYDSDDTNFYIDLAGNSKFKNIYVRNTSSTDSLLAYGSTFGYASSYKTLVIGNEAYTTTCIGVDPNSNPSGSFNGGGSGVEVMFKRGVYFISPNSSNNSYDSNFYMGDGYAASPGSLRAPIFYDSNNTGYYLDPNGTSKLSTLYLPGGIAAETASVNYYENALEIRETAFGGVLTDTWSNAPRIGFHWSGRVGMQIGMSSSGHLHILDGTAGGYVPLYSGTIYAPALYDSNNTNYYVDPASSTSIVTAGNASFSAGVMVLRSNSIEDHATNAGSNIAINYVGYAGGTTQWRNFTVYDGKGGLRLITYGAGNYTEATGSLRAPIFYDSDDTAYYLDPRSSDSANFRGYLNFGGDYGAGVVGLYNASRYQLVYAMGRAYTGAIDGTNVTGGYGLWWSHPNAGGVASNLNTHGLMSIVNGAWEASFASSTRAATDMRAPIFYDLDNTTYYLNPASSSYMYDMTMANTIYSYGWFRSYGDTGWYSQTYAGGIYMIDTTWVRVYNSKAFYVANEIAATGNITAYYSDERLKTKTGTISNAINKVQALEGFTYVENELAKSLGYSNEKQQVGVSAQQVQAVLPEAVSLAPVDFETLEDGTIVSKSGENYLTVDYSRLVPLLVEAIKEQQAYINTLEDKVNSILQKLEGN